MLPRLVLGAKAARPILLRLVLSYRVVRCDRSRYFLHLARHDHELNGPAADPRRFCSPPILREKELPRGEWRERDLGTLWLYRLQRRLDC